MLGVGTIGTTTTQCPAGERATGGGAGVTGLAFNTYALDGEPIEADGTVPEDGDVITGWRASGFNGGVVPQTLTVTVLCAS